MTSSPHSLPSSDLLAFSGPPEDAAALLATELSRLKDMSKKSLREIASETGLSVSAVHAAIKGDSVPTLGTLTAILKALNVNPERYLNLHKKASVRETSASTPDLIADAWNQFSRLSSTRMSRHAGLDTEFRFAFALAWLFQTPKGIAKAYAEAWEAVASSSYISGMAMSRWVIESICADRGIEGVSLPKAIAQLYERREIDVELYRRAEWTIRLANAAVHARDEGVSKADAEDALALAGALLAKIYVINTGVDRQSVEHHWIRQTSAPPANEINLEAERPTDQSDLPMAGKFELYKDAKSKYRFRLKARNGEIIAVGEAYSSKAGAIRGIDSIRRNAPDGTLVDQTGE